MPADLTCGERTPWRPADLLNRAREGDDDAFRLLTDPYRRELLHCYRMLGSVADAQNAVPETLLAASARTGIPHEQTESMSLAFVAAAKTLPPRQLAVLVLRDVPGFRASEVADLLDTTVPSVNSSLTRGRRGLEHRRAQLGPTGVGPAVGSVAETRIAERFVRAYESADVEALVDLFTDDIYLAMPSMTLEYEGREAATLFFERLLVSGRRYRGHHASPTLPQHVRRPHRRRCCRGVLDWGSMLSHRWALENAVPRLLLAEDGDPATNPNT